MFNNIKAMQVSDHFELVSTKLTRPHVASRLNEITSAVHWTWCAFHIAGVQNLICICLSFFFLVNSIIQFSVAYYIVKQSLLILYFIFIFSKCKSLLADLIPGATKTDQKKWSPRVHLSGLENAFAYQLTEFIIA